MFPINLRENESVLVYFIEYKFGDMLFKPFRFTCLDIQSSKSDLELTKIICLLSIC